MTTPAPEWLTRPEIDKFFQGLIDGSEDCDSSDPEDPWVKQCLLVRDMTLAALDAREALELIFDSDEDGVAVDPKSGRYVTVWTVAEQALKGGRQ